MKNKKLIYLFGAGRSGSTVLATVLNNNKKICSVGEMHHFFPFLDKNENCSCGEPFNKCKYWSDILAQLPEHYKGNPELYSNLCKQFEYHKSIPKHIFGTLKKAKFDEYSSVQRYILDILWQDHDFYILDSAKYIGRYLAMKKLYGKKVKGIFLIRDIRGVIWSFKKKVQTQSSPARTVLYYWLINSLAQFIVWFSPKDEVIKIRYEDIVDHPQITFSKIGDFLEVDLSEIITKVENNIEFDVPHIVGGNRMKKNKHIGLRKDDNWNKNMPLSQKTLYYYLALPLMLLNRYKVSK